MIRTLKEILEKIKLSPGLADRLADSADIVAEVGLDSLEMMEFLLEVESRLEVEIDFDQLDFSYLSSIEKLAQHLASRPRVPPGGARS